jgi:hypothetical protein
MGKGIYGDLQGDESRVAGRGNTTDMMQDHLRDNDICEGDVVATLRMLWNGGVMSLFNGEVDKIRQQWLGMSPHLEEGEVKEGEERAHRKYRDRLEERIQACISRATVGNPAALERAGGKLSNGYRIRVTPQVTTQTD